MMVGKPVIYLYPTKTQETYVELNISGKILSSYPRYDQHMHGWKVIAYPDGNLVNKSDNREYSYLFWEAETYNFKINWSSGFVVAGEETQKFLQEKLAEIGLIPKEYNEFIVYWLPKMEHNPYNLIHFAGKEYTDIAPLIITPKPDSILRVFMVYKPLVEKIEVTPQKLESFGRKGFSVVEWGGSEIN